MRKKEPYYLKRRLDIKFTTLNRDAGETFNVRTTAKITQLYKMNQIFAK